jgi:recombination protein RecR
MHYPRAFRDLITHFSSLPSVGPKMAERVVLHLFKTDPEQLTDFAESLEALTQLSFCNHCFHIAENGLCDICKDPKRDPKTVCVVEEPMDVIAIERTGHYEGQYHVLGGVMVTGGGNDDLRIPELLKRIGSDEVEEVILALNPIPEGDLTALYLRKKFADFDGLRISRLARGLAQGGDIEYADESTLSSALTNRESLS